MGGALVTENVRMTWVSLAIIAAVKRVRDLTASMVMGN